MIFFFLGILLSIAGDNVPANEFEESKPSDPAAQTCEHPHHLYLYRPLADQLSEFLNKASMNKKERKLQLSSTSASSSHQVRTKKDRAEDNDASQSDNQLRLDLSSLNEILEVNTENNWVRVQSKVTMEGLVKATLVQDRIPAVVPEFKRITVGGAIMGAALESSSHRHGQVSDTVREATLLLANATLVTVSPTSYSDLYHALPGSHGTLGIILEATLDLIPVSSGGRVRVDVTASIIGDDDESTTGGPPLHQQIQQLTQRAISQQDDFLDALYFPDGPKLVTLAGSFVHDDTSSSLLLDLPHLELTSRSLWFYEYIQQQLSMNTSFSFTMSIYDYLFRYDYGAFWMARPLQFSWKALAQEPHLMGPFVMASQSMRSIFGPLYTTHNMYRMLHKFHPQAVAEQFVILDAYLPSSNASQYLDFLRHAIPTSTPIWICPVRPPSQPQPLSPSGRTTDTTVQMYLNVPLWGRVSDGGGIQHVATMEEELLRLGGRKMLYSPSNMTASQLYQHHVDGDAYHQLRHHYDPHVIFPALHEKLQLQDGHHESFHNNHQSWHYWISRMLL